MKPGRRLLSLAAGVAGVAVAGAAGKVAARRRSLARVEPTREVPLGSLRAEPLLVLTDDGVTLHVEVDEVGDGGPHTTIVFVHGFALTLDCWHFQRAAYRGLVRSVFYDQRSHGRSGRSLPAHATLDDLGRDLKRVIEATTTGPVVLVGHSMGGMAVLALAEQAPELFAERVVGVALIASSAGGLGVHKMLLPFVPTALSSRLVGPTLRLLSRGHWAIDGVRRASRPVALVATDQLGFGPGVPEEYVAFVDAMLAATPFDVLASFYPNFASLKKYDALAVLGDLPTTIVCGAEDEITDVSHSHDLHERLPDSTLMLCPGAGHMVIMERHDQVNSALDQLLAASTERLSG
ncbi:MAG: alpha/beta fold hydrolase [Nocardioides sp.]